MQVVERSAAPGGAIRTEEATLPGFRHDLFAMNLNLFAGSRFFAEHAKELGIEFVHSPRPFASVFPEGRSIAITTDAEATLASISAVAADDAERWVEAARRFDRVAPHVLPMLGAPMPSVASARALRRGRRALGKEWPYELARLALQSPREFAEEHFASDEMRSLIAAWGMHLDFAPDVAGGAIFPFLETFASAQHGMVIGKGGASAMIDAMLRACERNGARVELGNGASSITVDRGLATGVVLDEWSADRRASQRRGQSGATARVRWARAQRCGSSQVPPRREALQARSRNHDDSPRARHVAAVGSLGRAGELYLCACRGPACRYVRCVCAGPGRPAALGTRAGPSGSQPLSTQAGRRRASTFCGSRFAWCRATSWATRPPRSVRPTGDEAKEPLADRILAQLESYAPGLSRSVLGRCVLSPLDLERYNSNLIGATRSGGSHHPMQYYFLRPVPGWSRYRTPIDRLYLCGASTWPGAGVGAGSGYVLGSKLAGRSRLARLGGRR